MVVEEKQKLNKQLYLLEIKLLKILPFLTAFIYFINTILSAFGIDISALSYISGMSLLPIIFVYLSSYVFKFCEYHRIFIHYVLILEILTTVKWYYPVIVTSELVLNISFILSGLLMLCVVFFNVYKIYKKYRRPSN